MNTPQITELISDARLALDILNDCHSPAFRQAAARQLMDIAAQLQSAVSDPEHPTLKESVEKFHAAVNDETEDDRPVIDLAFKYRTRDGRAVTGLMMRQGGLAYPIEGYVEGGARSWDIYGRLVSDYNHECDLIPTGEPA